MAYEQQSGLNFLGPDEDDELKPFKGKGLISTKLIEKYLSLWPKPPVVREVTDMERKLDVVLKDMRRVMDEAMRAWKIETDAQLIDMLKLTTATYLTSIEETMAQFSHVSIDDILGQKIKEIPISIKDFNK